MCGFSLQNDSYACNKTDLNPSPGLQGACSLDFQTHMTPSKVLQNLVYFFMNRVESTLLCFTTLFF